MKKIIITILLLLFSCMILTSIMNILIWNKENNDLNHEIKKIQDQIVIKPVDDKNAEILNHGIVDNGKNFYSDYIKMKLINVDFNKLKNINEETVGWIQVNGTNINYPFVQHEDNEYYLTHSFEKKKNSAGWVFLDYRNNISEEEKNTIIYAHGRLNEVMFGTLKNILKGDWTKDKDNFVVKMSTEYENTLWQVFSIYQIPTTSDYLHISFSNDEQYQEFLNILVDRSDYDFHTQVSQKDRMITLSTCYNDKDKVVLHAKLIKREKK